MKDQNYVAVKLMNNTTNTALCILHGGHAALAVPEAPEGNHRTFVHTKYSLALRG